MTRIPSRTMTKAGVIAGLCLAILCATVSLHAAPVSAPASDTTSADKSPAPPAPTR